MSRSYLPNGTQLKREQSGTRYIIEQELAMGGFGMTYRAVDTLLERIVAIKEFFPNGCRRVGQSLNAGGDWADRTLEKAVQSFNEEGKTLGALKHANIIQTQPASFEQMA